MTTGTASANPSAAAACWSCGAAVSGGHFCAGCGRIQPLARGADYFSFFGLPRKLTLDATDLESRFHQLSWKLHPDNFAGSSEFERELSLERSSQLNDAYRALREPLSRVEYLLALAGMRKEGQQKQQAPPELLEEVFDLNESLDELRGARRSGGDPVEMTSLRKRLQAARENFLEKLGEVDRSLEQLFAEWDRALDAAPDAPSDAQVPAQWKLMERMNEALNRRSYIRNLAENVQKELTEA
ncbi:MAG TPA: Fe-S protein assembly co-chaperone HscB [Candidatus Acidoferrales bacterium]